MRSSRRPGGSGRAGRGLSPPPRATNEATTKSRDNHRSEWRPHCSRRSLSPPKRDRPHQRHPSRDRWTLSSERRRDYNAIASSRDHEREKQHLRRDNSSPQPSHSLAACSTRAPFHDDVDVGRCGIYDTLNRRYLEMESPSVAHSKVNPKLSDFRSFQVDNCSGAASFSGAGHDGQSTLVRETMFLDDGSLRTFYSLPQEQGSHIPDAAPVNPNIGRGSGVGTLRIGPCGSDEGKYIERLTERYIERDKRNVYRRDVPFSRMPLSPPRAWDGVPFSGMPPGQSRAYGSTSYGVAEDDSLGLYRDGLHPSSDGFFRTNDFHRLGDDSLGHDKLNHMQLLDPQNCRTLSRQVREDGYCDFVQRGRSSRGFPLSDDLHRETFRSAYSDSLGARVNEVEASPKFVKQTGSWDHHPSVERVAISNYRDPNMVHSRYLGRTRSDSLMFGSRPSHESEFAYFGGSYVSGRDSGLAGYRERSRSSPLSDHGGEIYQHDCCSPRGRVGTEDLDICDPSSKRMINRKYTGDDERSILPNTRNARSVLSNTRNAFKRIIEPSDNSELWGDGNRVNLRSKRLGFDHPQHKMLSRRLSDHDGLFPSRGSFVRMGAGRDINLKLRLRPRTSNPNASTYRRHDFNSLRKFQKKSFEDQHAANAHDQDDLKNDILVIKSAPPEDSEEFKQQTHKAFLRFSKLLNENSHQQKRYWDQGGTHSLLCCVCGSLSKEFVDTHSLVTHAFYSLKSGLRTDHLGLHKALCVLMGWNWLVPPDNPKVYQSIPIVEAKALKEDLVLWPPVIIVHNSSIGNKDINCGPKALTKEGLEEILRGMGFEMAKMRIGQGKSADESVLLVKFMPTFSGLQEAEKLQKYFSDNNHGRKEFQDLSYNRNSSGSGVKVAVEAVQLLYGYIGTPEDLCKLDLETKKRCLVKSKKEIEAIAEAPLRVE